MKNKVNRFSRNMAYILFVSKLIDYAEKYRGMQFIIMHELKGFAEVRFIIRESDV